MDDSSALFRSAMIDVLFDQFCELAISNQLLSTPHLDKMTDALAVAETHPARQELMAKQLVGLLRPGVVVTFTALLGRQNRDDLNGASGVVLGAFKDGGFPVLVLRENSMGRPEQLRLRLENILPAPQEHPARAIESVANVFDTAELMSDVAAQLPVAHLCRFAAVCAGARAGVAAVVQEHIRRQPLPLRAHFCVRTGEKGSPAYNGDLVRGIKVALQDLSGDQAELNDTLGAIHSYSDEKRAWVVNMLRGQDLASYEAWGCAAPGRRLHVKSENLVAITPRKTLVQLASAPELDRAELAAALWGLDPADEKDAALQAQTLMEMAAGRPDDLRAAGASECVLKLILEAPPTGETSLNLQAAGSAVVNELGGCPMPRLPGDERNFGSWRGIPRCIGGVFGRGSLTHLDPEGHLNIFGGGLATDYNEHVENATKIRSMPNFSMMESPYPEEREYAKFRQGVVDACELLAGRGSGLVAIGRHNIMHRLVVHPLDCLAVLLGYLDRRAGGLVDSSDEMDVFSRLPFDEVAFKMRYVSLAICEGSLTACPKGDIEEVMAEHLTPTQIAHVDQVIEHMRELPEGVWMCSFCACPTNKNYGLRSYCCPSCLQRDAKLYAHEKDIASSIIQEIRDGCSAGAVPLRKQKLILVAR